jgi:catechol 2,3-dioxygenase-like lactoylglutathione lyase family enzyme
LFSMLNLCSCLTALALLAVGGLEASQTRVASSSPVRQIDHIMIRTGNPDELYSFLTATLTLPIAWPLTSPREGVMTGGVGVGNVNLEAIRFPGQTELQPRLLGFALEPSPLDESVRQLTLRGLALGDRREIVGSRPDGSRGALWTNVALRQFSDSDNPADATHYVFLSEYSAAYLDVAQRRARLRQQLAASGGGSLGVVGLKEVIVGVSDLESARRLWQRLLDPARSSGPGTWQVGDGPAIRLVSAPQNRMQALVIRVASLDRAKAFLRANNLLGAETEGHVSIASSKLAGVDIRLVSR